MVGGDVIQVGLVDGANSGVGMVPLSISVCVCESVCLSDNARAFNVVQH